MKAAKKRSVDFSLDEMAKRADLPRKAFIDRLKRVCELYDFNLGQFKEIPDETDSNYFFPPEVADYVLLLVKNIDRHPLYPRNAREDKVTAKQVAEFNNAILIDIDNSVCMPVKEIMYNRLAHLVAERVAYWSKPLVKHLTRFLINNVALSTEDVGAALSLFTKELDKMNYCLFRADYIKRFAIKGNVEASIDEELSGEAKRANEILNNSNVSMDTIIAELIRIEFERVEDIRQDNFQRPIDRIASCYSASRFCGYLDNGDVAINRLQALGKNPDVDAEREIYSDYFIRNGDCEARYEQNKYIINHVREEERRWKPIDTVIAADDEETQTDITIMISEQIESYERKIQELKIMRNELTEMTASERETFLRDLQNSYVNHCRDIDHDYGGLMEITDLYIGQALNEFLK